MWVNMQTNIFIILIPTSWVYSRTFFDV